MYSQGWGAVNHDLGAYGANKDAGVLIGEVCGECDTLELRIQCQEQFCFACMDGRC